MAPSPATDSLAAPMLAVYRDEAGRMSFASVEIVDRTADRLAVLSPAPMTLGHSLSLRGPSAGAEWPRAVVASCARDGDRWRIALRR